MDKFSKYLQQFDITLNVSEDEIVKAKELLQLYSPILRRAGRNIEEMEDVCYESRRQSVSDFINLAIDFDQDADCRHISERLASMGHSMNLLSIMDEALRLVRDDPAHGKLYYSMLQRRYFDAYCTSNEDAFLSLGMSSSSYYRNMSKAIRLFAANLWCVVIPDLVIREQIQRSQDESLSGSEMTGKIAV